MIARVRGVIAARAAAGSSNRCSTSAADAHAVRNADEVGEAPLELGDLRAEHERRTLDDFVDPPPDLLGDFALLPAEVDQRDHAHTSSSLPRAASDPSIASSAAITSIPSRGPERDTAPSSTQSRKCRHSFRRG